MGRIMRAAAAALAAVALATLAACGSDDPLGHPWRPGGPATEAGVPAQFPDLSGGIAGAGSSAQESAMQAWVAGFQTAAPGVSVAYDPVGSGGGRTQFVAGGIEFGGTDAPLDPEELAGAQQRCEPGDVAEMPLYISPIAVVFNLAGIDALNMSPATVAGIFDGAITRWDAPELVAENPGIDLPDLRITPVNRSDESGTTENFTEYLHEAAAGQWPHPPSGNWPRSGGQSAQGNSGVIQTVTEARGTVTYADASKAGALGTARLGVGDQWVGFSPEAAAAVVDASPATEDATDLRLTIDLARDTQESGAYPIVLVSYSIACSTYDSDQDAENVKALLTYIASEEGQERAADPSVAGSAPISDTLRESVTAAIEQIEAV